MTSDDPWARPEAREDTAAQAAGALAQPGGPMAQAAGAMAQPAQAPAVHYGIFEGASAGIAVQRPRRITSDPLLRTASGLLIGSALAKVWFFFTHVGANPPQFEYVSELAREGYILVLTLTAAVLLLLPKTREVTKGAVIAIGLIFLARDFDALRPSAFNPQAGRSAHWSIDAGFVLFAAAGVLVLIRILREARRPRDRQSRVDRIAAVLGGLLGAVLWTVATLVDKVHITERIGPAAGANRTDCCGWTHVDNWGRSAYIVTDVVVLLLVLLAATGRSRSRSLGLMLGTALLLAADLLDATIQMLTPVASVFGASRADQAAREGLELTISPLAGYWVTVFAIIVLGVVAALRYGLAPRQAPYPELRPRPPRR